mmetsp:Transcript_25937/g.78875  ORF Transcript_25937/g.78875 Transcript_25937/m.78875 type:complete len:297 (-) Transcript_25937:2280-3170(-)
MVLTLASHPKRVDQRIELRYLADTSPGLFAYHLAVGTAQWPLAYQEAAVVCPRLLALGRPPQNHVFSPVAIEAYGLLPQASYAPCEHNEVFVQLLAELILADAHLVEVAALHMLRRLVHLLRALAPALHITLPVPAAVPTLAILCRRLGAEDLQLRGIRLLSLLSLAVALPIGLTVLTIGLARLSALAVACTAHFRGGLPRASAIVRELERPGDVVLRGQFCLLLRLYLRVAILVLRAFQILELVVCLRGCLEKPRTQRRLRKQLDHAFRNQAPHLYSKRRVIIDVLKRFDRRGPF